MSTRCSVTTMTSSHQHRGEEMHTGRSMGELPPKPTELPARPRPPDGRPWPPHAPGYHGRKPRCPRSPTRTRRAARLPTRSEPTLACTGSRRTRQPRWQSDSSSSAIVFTVGLGFDGCDLVMWPIVITDVHRSTFPCGPASAAPALIGCSPQTWVKPMSWSKSPADNHVTPELRLVDSTVAVSSSISDLQATAVSGIWPTTASCHSVIAAVPRQRPATHDAEKCLPCPGH